MPSQRAERYPWGSETPGPRLRNTCARTRTALEQANEAGFQGIATRVNAVVKAATPLDETMSHVAREGLRTVGKDAETVPGEDVSEAVRAVRETLVALHASTALTQSARYEAFVGALETLMGLADTGIKHGIRGTGAADPNDPWGTFET